MAETQLAPGGETTVVYETGSGYDTDAHIAFVRAGELQGHLRLGNWAPVALSGLSLDSENRAVVVAFRNVGDGAATLFVLLRWHGDSYEVVLQRLTQQGRLKIFQGGEAGLELWSAREDLDDGISCVWCDHRYEVERLEWRKQELEPVRQWLTKKALNPYRMSEQPIMLVDGKQSP